MENRRNLCAHIPISLFNRVGAEREKAGLTNSEYVTGLLEEYFTMKDSGGNVMAQNNGETRTLAFQISEDLFQRVKAYLERESKRRGRKVTQKDFVVGLIEQALEESEREASRTEETAAGQPGQTDSQPETNADAPNEEPETDADGEEDTEDMEEDGSAESAENAPADAVEDADSADGSRSPEGN